MELQEIEELAGLFREHPISEISVERPGRRIYLRRGVGTPIRSVSTPTDIQAELSDEPASGTDVNGEPDKSVPLLSQMVGVFHHVSPPIRVGSTVQEGQVVGNVESLKLMNEVVANVSGEVTEVSVDDGVPVEYGLCLFKVIPR